MVRQPEQWVQQRLMRGEACREISLLVTENRIYCKLYSIFTSPDACNPFRQFCVSGVGDHHHFIENQRTGLY